MTDVGDMHAILNTMQDKHQSQCTSYYHTLQPTTIMYSLVSKQATSSESRKMTLLECSTSDLAFSYSFSAICWARWDGSVQQRATLRMLVRPSMSHCMASWYQTCDTNQDENNIHFNTLAVRGQNQIRLVQQEDYLLWISYSVESNGPALWERLHRKQTTMLTQMKKIH